MPQQCRQAFSYERLENVGDSLLKFATCTALFSSYPSARGGLVASAPQGSASEIATPAVLTPLPGRRHSLPGAILAENPPARLGARL